MAHSVAALQHPELLAWAKAEESEAVSAIYAVLRVNHAAEKTLEVVSMISQEGALPTVQLVTERVLQLGQARWPLDSGVVHEAIGVLVDEGWLKVCACLYYTYLEQACLPNDFRKVAGRGRCNTVNEILSRKGAMRLLSVTSGAPTGIQCHRTEYH